ncbi:MAG: hypothetical protein OEW67_10695 [Cyclobacteriaceae bacterium]|nr:hypothetical protein [Cyclobacteriaceae bacterium]
MSTVTSKISTWFWVITVIMLLWNLVGIISFLQHITIPDEVLQNLPDNERELYENYPLWTTIAFALAVFGGFIGCIYLLLKKKFAKPILIISLIAVVMQMYHSIFIAKAMDVYGPGAAVMPIMVILIALFLVWLASFSINKNWIK